MHVDFVVAFQILHCPEEVRKIGGTKGEGAGEALHVQRPASPGGSLSNNSAQLLAEQIVPSHVKTQPFQWHYNRTPTIPVPIFGDLSCTGLHEPNSAG